MADEEQVEPRTERPVRKPRARPSTGERPEPAHDGDGRRPRRSEDGGEVVSAATAARRAARHVVEFTGRQPECVVSLEGTDDGWTVGVEVVETHRIPDTTDVLAIYEVHLDRRGDLRSYRRTRRYARGQLDKR